MNHFTLSTIHLAIVQLYTKQNRKQLRNLLSEKNNWLYSWYFWISMLTHFVKTEILIWCCQWISIFMSNCLAQTKKHGIWNLTVGLWITWNIQMLEIGCADKLKPFIKSNIRDSLWLSWPTHFIRIRLGVWERIIKNVG